MIVAVLAAVTAFTFDMAQAKRQPGQESIVQQQYLKPSTGYGSPLADKIGSDGFAKRLYHPQFKSRFTEPEQIASNYLEQEGSSLGVQAGELTLLSAKESLAGHHFRYQQVWHGIPVFSRQVLINIGNEGEIISVISDFKPIADVATIPAITSERAIYVAQTELAAKNLDGEPSGELVVYADGESPALCWMVSFVANQPLGDWQVFVNALSGEILAKKNRMCFVDGSGYVFDPNPVVSERTLTLSDSTDRNYTALTSARHDVILRELNSPTGGYYYLTGPYVSTSPTSNRAHFADPDSFHFNRQDDRFEEVEVYYQLDSCERFYQALGFTNVMTYPITIAVNGTTDDNSWYTPSQHRITYGSGGVDDAEDGDVIVHEYGHATQDNQVPGWGQTHEGGSMGEGFGDYLTVSLFHPIFNNWDEAKVFDWDANPRDNFWSGRRVDTNKHYPEDMTGEVHDDGEIWSRCLWDIQNDIGYDTTLQLILESHFALTTQANFDDAANAIVDADLEMYGGRHLLAIGQAFVDRGIFDELPVELNIIHTPLVDTENYNQYFAITATLTHTFAIDSVFTYYRYLPESSFTELSMAPTGNPNEYSTSIPPAGHAVEIGYYLRAVDSLGLMTALPPNAPIGTFEFYAGPDMVAPAITHMPIVDMPALQWPPTVTAAVTDNIGVDSVWVEFMVNAGSPVILPLTRQESTNIWQGQLTGAAAIGDSVRYRVIARDASFSGNVAYLPQSGYYQFRILSLNAYTYVRSGFAINDYPGQARFDTFTVSENFEIFEADVYVDIDHPDISELYFYVRSPLNTRVVLHNRTGGDGDSIVGWYDDDIVPDGPGDLGQLAGQQAHGQWMFYISDRVAGNTGTVNGWILRLVVPGEVGVAEQNETIPGAFALESNYPNPFNPATMINFSIPMESRVRLEIFDLLGRVVQILVDDNLPAGHHSIEWNGRTSAGEHASSGVYFARLISGDNQSVIRMSLLK
jgi:subtilisin-like proprotein convertase family protein